eukprot:3225302-Rhodomonas_salina.2
MHGRTAWQQGHELVVYAWAELAKEANVLVDTRQGMLPRPVHTGTDQRGDIKFNLRGPSVTSPSPTWRWAQDQGWRSGGHSSIRHWETGSGPRTAPMPPSIGTRTWSSWPWLAPPHWECSWQWGWPCTAIWHI